MIKYLVVIGVIWAVYYFFIKKKPIKNQYSNEPKQTKEASYNNDMLKCESCGIYCEIDDSILNSGKYYCSDECVKKGKL